MEYNNSNRIHATHSVGARDIRTAGGPGLSGRGVGGRAPFAYLTRLPPGKAVLWCYLIWYLSTVAHHFDPSPKLWLNALGISGVIGVALQLSVAGATRPERWQTARLFMMPFGVSSFSALIKGQGGFDDRPLKASWTVNRVAQASRYLLDDGHVVLAEHFHGMRVLIEGVWRDVPSAVMNRRVIGHVVAVYECDGIGARLVTGEVA